VRIRNKETPTVKVNDADGNPIEIAAVVVWQVRDSARATYGVDDFVAFVDIQSETALRHIANVHPYDNTSTEILSLRDHTDEVAVQLATEIAVRVAPAGVDVIEARITRLSYAPEIAQVMLQRQQAGAVIAARTRIVDGAVGWSRWRWRVSPRRASSNSTKNERRRWSRTSSSCCAATAGRNRSSTPGRCTVARVQGPPVRAQEHPLAA